MEYCRRIVSLFMLNTFLVLVGSGILSYFTEYTRGIATVHTVFGVLFTAVGLMHLINNIKPLQKYSKRGALMAIGVGISILAYCSFFEVSFAKTFMDFGARSKVHIGKTNDHTYSKIEMNLSKEYQLTLDIKRNIHFWHPQIAIWTEDMKGAYIETLFVTKATAKGIFAGGRTKENFKTKDKEI